MQGKSDPIRIRAILHGAKQDVFVKDLTPFREPDEHPTPNIQCAPQWPPLDVGCWIFPPVQGFNARKSFGEISPSPLLASVPPWLIARLALIESREKLLLLRIFIQVDR